MRNEKLSELIRMFDLTEKMAGLKGYFVIFDFDGRVLYLSSNTDVLGKLRIGHRYTDETGTLERVLKKGEIVSYKVQDEKTQKWFRGNGVPIYDRGEIAGAVTMLCEGLDEDSRILWQRLHLIENEMKQKEWRDELTGLYNRNALEERKKNIAEKALQPGWCLFALVADLNGLKYINDNFGHIKGDKAIAVLGKILKSIAEAKVECFRIGGDEFEVLGAFPETDKFPELFVERLQEKMKQYNAKESLPYRFEASFGYVFEPMSYKEDLDGYVKIADSRMYAMKKAMKQKRAKLESEWSEQIREVDYGKDKILIADDDRLIRSILKSFFDEEQIVMEAVNGQEALDKIKKEDFSLICLDINMPILDGFGVIDAIKEQDISNHAPIILITAAEDEAVESRGYSAGVADFIKKPFNFVIAKHRMLN